MKKLKLMTIVGTRPEIIRLSEVIKLADKCFDQVLVHTGQNYDYELNQVFFDELSLPQPDEFLNVAKGQPLGDAVGAIIASSFSVMEKHRPDAVLILGDTNSCLSAYAAKRLKIPTFHMEAGNRCFDQNVPEEVNRRVVDVLSDINMTYTEHSRRYLLQEGARKEYTFVTGSPMLEVLQKHEAAINASDVLSRLKLESKKYVLVSAHREENIDDPVRFQRLMDSINAVAEKYNDMKVVYSVHPRSKKFIESRGFEFKDNVMQSVPFGFIDYNALQKDAFVVISDSGTLSEESAMLSFPAILIRNSTERPESIDMGTIIVGGIDQDSVLSSIETLYNSFDFSANYKLPADYQDNHVSQKVVRIIQSYVPIINEFIWRKK